MSPMDPNRGSRERYSLRRMKPKASERAKKSKESSFILNSYRRKFLVATVSSEILLLLLFASLLSYDGEVFDELCGDAKVQQLPDGNQSSAVFASEEAITQNYDYERNLTVVNGVNEQSDFNSNVSSTVKEVNVSPKCSNVKPVGKSKFPSSETSAKSFTYKMFMDVHVMIFIGFGFLMTFLRRYGYSSVGLNMLVAALSIQWAVLASGFFRMSNGRIPINIESILSADLATATVLISLGAVLGKTSPLQLLVMAIGEIVVFATNEWLGLHVFQAVDAGGSMFVHVFGAYFGLAVSYVLSRGGTDRHHSANEGASYRSDLFAMIGTIFLWIFWPSFNASLVTGDQQQRAIINTYFALASCCVTAFAMSATVTKGFKFDMVHIQNATLAGGVAVGTAADMMLQPYGALLVGMVAGILSVFGYHFLQPFLLSKLNVHDTCGVHNLHGMPGVMAGLVGAIMAGIASEKDYNYSLYMLFPARAPLANSTHFEEVSQDLSEVLPGLDRSAAGQAAHQLLALACTLLIALASGLIMGIVLKLPFLSHVPQELLYDDKFNWEVPEVGDEEAAGTERTTGTIYIPDVKRTGQSGIVVEDS